MGAQASTNKVKTEVEINNEAINKCGSTTVTNAIIMKKAKITCPKDCAGKCKLNVTQGAAVDASCLIKAHQDALSESMATMDAKTKAGLGFGASTNVSDMKKTIKNKIQSECGGASATQKIDASEMQLEMCDVTFAQNATAKSKCELGAIQALRDKTELAVKAATEGVDPMKAYAGIIGMVVLGIAALVVAIFLLPKLLGNSSKSPQMMQMSGGMSPQMGGMAPQMGGMAPQMGGMAPQMGSMSPQMGGMAPQMGGMSPQMGGMGGMLQQQASGLMQQGMQQGMDKVGNIATGMLSKAMKMKFGRRY